MTDDMMELHSLLEKAPDADILRDMIAFAAGRLMEMEAGSLTGAGYGEKSPMRLVQRNGHRARLTDAGRCHRTCASPGCARAATFPASWSHGA